VMPWEEVRKDARLIKQFKPNRFDKLKPFSGILSILILIVLVGIILYPKIFQGDSLRKLRASDGRIPLAVMPFQNMSNDSTLNYLKEWIPESVISYLSNFSEDFQVRQTETIYSVIKSQGLTSNASMTPSVAALISQKLDASIFISGSLTRTGTGILINAKLINSKTEEVLKSFQEKGISEEIIQKIDTLSQKIKDYLTVSRLKKKLNPEDQSWISTSSPEALKHYILGSDARRDFKNNSDLSKDLAHEEFSKAVRIDSNFTEAYLSFIGSYIDKELYDSAKIYCLRLYNKRDQMTPQLTLKTEILYSALFKIPSTCIKYIKQLLELDDQQPGAYSGLGFWYRVAGQPENSILPFEKSLEIYYKWGIKPPLVSNYIQLGESYCDTKQYKKAERLYKKAEMDFPDNEEIRWYEFQVAEEAKDTVAANYYLKKFITLSRENSRSEFYIAISIANIYEVWDSHEKAEEYIQKALTLPPDNPEAINTLAWSLIILDHNINEGLELTDLALKLDPHNAAIWDTKGWGLYKRGKYKEALDALQKADSIYPKPDPDIIYHIQEVKKAIANKK
jgi:tetratricopeptide (TPR) repeat protein